MAAALFDFLKSINETKEDLLTTEENIKSYTPFIINRGIGQTLDGILLANEMNKLPAITKEMNYSFFMNIVKKQKRYAKWSKKLDIDSRLNTIMSYYQVSLEKAIEYNKLLSQEQIDSLDNRMFQGGKTKRKI